MLVTPKSIVQQKRFSYQAGYSVTEFVCYVIDGETIGFIEPDGCSFGFSNMPLEIWREVNTWIESVT